MVLTLMHVWPATTHVCFKCLLHLLVRAFSCLVFNQHAHVFFACITTVVKNRFVILGAMHGAWSGLVLPCAPALSTWMSCAVSGCFDAYVAACQVLVAFIVACVLFRFADKEPRVLEKLRCMSNEASTCLQGC